MNGLNIVKVNWKIKNNLQKHKMSGSLLKDTLTLCKNIDLNKLSSHVVIKGDTALVLIDSFLGEFMKNICDHSFEMNDKYFYIEKNEYELILSRLKIFILFFDDEFIHTLQLLHDTGESYLYNRARKLIFLDIKKITSGTDYNLKKIALNHPEYIGCKLEDFTKNIQRLPKGNYVINKSHIFYNIINLNRPIIRTIQSTDTDYLISAEEYNKVKNLFEKQILNNINKFKDTDLSKIALDNDSVLGILVKKLDIEHSLYDDKYLVDDKIVDELLRDINLLKRRHKHLNCSYYNHRIEEILIILNQLPIEKIK